MNNLERVHLMKQLTLRANKIIAEKKLHFDWFFETTNLYEYNTYIARNPDYQKLTTEEYEILLIIVKQQYERIELL